jgi:hypothetical protein
MTLSELFDKANEMVSKRYPDCNASIKEMNSYRDGYIHGMTEKLEGMIPIEKACAWLKEYGDDFGVPESESGRVYVDDLVYEFRKAMEE